MPPNNPDDTLLGRVTEAIRHWAATRTRSDPTSQITGGGAIAEVEAWASTMHSGRRAILMPSGTYAIRIALQVLGVKPGHEVLVPALDWPASRAAARSLGARARPVDVSPTELTIAPSAAAAARTAKTKAVVACHLHGVPADVPALRDALPGVPVVEDCAHALGATLDGTLVGTLGDVAIFSFGPGKQIDAGEAGLLLFADERDYRAAARAACHPVRQLLAGVADPEVDAFSVRPHPLAAIMALHAISRWNSPRDHSAAIETLRAVSQWPECTPLSGGARRRIAGPALPVLVAPGSSAPAHISVRRSGARVLPGAVDPSLIDLARRICLAEVRPQ
jgi:hypothetical protein